MCACIFKGNFGNDTDKMQGETFETPIFTMKCLQNLLRSTGYSYLHTWQTGISFFTLHRKKKSQMQSIVSVTASSMYLFWSM